MKIIDKWIDKIPDTVYPPKFKAFLKKIVDGFLSLSFRLIIYSWLIYLFTVIIYGKYGFERTVIICFVSISFIMSFSLSTLTNEVRKNNMEFKNHSNSTLGGPK